MDKRLAYLRARFTELDSLLRGESTKPDAIEGHSLQVSARGLTLIAILLAMFYGLCMGSYSLLKEVPAELEGSSGPILQLLASMIKTPALFLLTLLVTLPSLYVANALIGSRLTLLGMARLLVASIAVNVAVLASLGTIVLFFSLTTKSYPFILLLNVTAFTVAGILGLKFLLQTLHRVTVAGESGNKSQVTQAEEGPEVDGDEVDEAAEKQQQDDSVELPQWSPEGEPSALDMPAGQVLGLHTRLVFRCWIVLFSLVGAQMGWVLRPFVGSPGVAFSFFRERGSNFFAAVFSALQQLLSGG